MPRQPILRPGLHRLIPLLAIGVLGHAASTVPADEAASTAPGPQRITLGAAATDVSGKKHDLAAARDLDGELRVFIFLDTECPIANRYIPTLNRLADTLRDRTGAPVAVFGVLSHPNITHEEAAAHSKEYRVTFPMLFDDHGILARTFQPTHTPDAFLLDDEGRVRFRGRIDNLYEELGTTRGEATEHHLIDAAVAVAAGKDVAVPYVEPVGCLYEDPWDRKRDSKE